MPTISGRTREARRVRARGVVQGVGFRPFVCRLASECGLDGWVLNDGSGVEIHVEGQPEALEDFLRRLKRDPPAAARVEQVRVAQTLATGRRGFSIRESRVTAHPRTTISSDLAMCALCRVEVFDPASRRYRHAYAGCSECGPRLSIVTDLPYDRSRTTMAGWPPCADCAREYADAGDRRFHMQAISCARCGPGYLLLSGAHTGRAAARDHEAIRRASEMLGDGAIVAIKGIGGYHLACDARSQRSVSALRERKYRKEKPFALMAKDLATARALVDLSADGEAVLTSPERPIVIARAREELPVVGPDDDSLGVMLPYSAMHELLFDAGAPDVLVLTSANRSSEPIAFDDDDALARLSGIADAFLVGERAIARRVEDSVVRAGARGVSMVRRGRGYAPGVTARLPSAPPIMALGADLKNAITLVLDGEAVTSQHIGDLEHLSARAAFETTVRDLLSMYRVRDEELLVVHDLHPQYVSTGFAAQLAARARVAVQHHRAHVASVLAERGELQRRVVGVAFDGTGYGDDGSIWGGEFFLGSVAQGFRRVGHLRQAALPGGDAAARHPVQAAAGYLAELLDLPDLCAAPFLFPARYRQACALVRRGVRTFPTTSAGRLFDVVAALLGFTREVTFEGQAAIWVERMARGGSPNHAPLIDWRDGELDFRPALAHLVRARAAGGGEADLARQFHFALGRGIAEAVRELCAEHKTDVVVLSGGVFQNELLVEDVVGQLRSSSIEVWTNALVPANDGGISVGQAALAQACPM